MNNSYVIRWRNKVNGRAGKGSKLFTIDEAERLAAELNEEYPDILHEAIPAAVDSVSAEAPDHAGALAAAA